MHTYNFNQFYSKMYSGHLDVSAFMYVHTFVRMYVYMYVLMYTL